MRGVRSEAAPLGALIIVGLVVALPALTGGYVDYMDNASHLAELRELAKPGATGWSDLAYSGFPIHMLQSPLLYRPLALLARWGLPLVPLYVAVTVVGLLAPSLALYWVARKRVAAPWALAAAASVLLYRGAIVGAIGASLGGMFGYNLATAALIVLLDRLARPERDLRALCATAALTAFIGLSHMYVTIALVYLAAIHGVASLAGGPSARRRLLYDVPAMGLGMVVAAAYWLPNFLARTPINVTDKKTLGAGVKTFFTVFSPQPPPSVATLSARLAFDPAHRIDGLVQMAVLLVALAGIPALLRSRDAAPRYGALMALIVGVMYAVQAKTNSHPLGPQAIRFIFILKIGMVLASLPLLAKLSESWRPSLLAALVPIAALSLLMERVTASEQIDGQSADMDDVRALWSWLRDHKTPAWGRVYLEDVFGTQATLQSSHVLSRTAEETGVEQFGSYYGSTPYPTELWQLTAFDEIFGEDARDPAIVDVAVARMERANGTHIVLQSPDLVARFAADPRMDRLGSIGHFTVFARRGVPSRWASTEGGEAVGVERLAPGRMRIAAAPSAPITVAESYHGFWRTEPAGVAVIRSTDDGLMSVGPRRDGAGAFELVYEPSRLPDLVSLVGASGLLAIFGFDAWKRRAAAGGFSGVQGAT
jgi:hypothetical protein